MKITNEIRSKVMKAAWTTFAKRSNWSFSACLKNAWKWAKESLLKDFTVWMPRNDFGRVYFGENRYMQFNIKSTSGNAHRMYKGETFATAYYKLVNITMSEVSQFMDKIAYQISNIGQTINMVPSNY